MGEKIIYRPAKFEALLDKLIEKGLFETYQAAMTFAAAVGWHFVKQREQKGKAGKDIRWSVFESANDDAFIHALALAEFGSIDILGRDRQNDDEDSIKIFEEYATAGLEYIQDHCVDVPGDTFDNLLSLIAEVIRTPKNITPGLEGLPPEAIDFFEL
jgi:dnd system-associated protein 4